MSNNDDSKNVIERKSINDEKVNIYVGLDFGTSSTKIVYSKGGDRYFRSLSFNHDLPGFPSYCVPSLVAINPTGRLVFGPDAARSLMNESWDSGLRRLKMLIAGDVDSSFDDEVTRRKFNRYCASKNLTELSPDRVTSIYLAWLMTITKEKIKLEEDLKDWQLNMTFNVGVPIEQMENNSVLDEFERVFKWAELIHKEWYRQDTDYEPLEKSYYWEDRIETLKNDDRRVFTIPESVAQVSCYTNSLEKREGLHAVLDFGAGTTDISIFQLSRDLGRMSGKWFSARNIPTGMDNIVRRLVEDDNSNAESDHTYEEIIERLNYLSNNPGEAKVVQRELKKIWRSEEYHETWGEAYGSYKKQDEWKDVEVFVCGGGSEFFEIAKEVFERPWEWSNISPREHSYRVRQLPEPDNFIPADQETPFIRMSVAYGLAKPKPKLDNYHLPSEVPDQTPPSLPKVKSDRDELYRAP